jgi:hypothetical protein
MEGGSMKEAKLNSKGAKAPKPTAAAPQTRRPVRTQYETSLAAAAKALMVEIEAMLKPGNVSIFVLMRKLLMLINVLKRLIECIKKRAAEGGKTAEVELAYFAALLEMAQMMFGVICEEYSDKYLLRKLGSIYSSHQR